MNRKSGIKFILVIFIIAFASFVALNGLSLWGPYEIPPLGQQVRQGLDLKGGLYVVYEAKFDSGEQDRDAKLTGAMRVIRNRLDKEGQHEATIAKQGENRIQVEIPGIKNPRELAEILAKPAVLEFEGPEGDIIITGQDVKTARPAYGEGHKAVVDFELHAEGAKKFADATTKYKGQVIKILLDKNPISEPVVQSAIVGGKGVIQGMKDIEEAKQLANLIESGALPVDLEQAETRTIGATLGVNALNQAIQAGIIGIVAILIFMLVYYRLPGLVADFALIIYLLIVLVVLVAAKITLTLPGIAGIILSAGMAVDANVIIFERIKEEIRSGKTLSSSVDSGFTKAFRAILDSNITTLIAAVVLLYFGTGPIQGFAKTLIIGILVSMFTAISFTRYVLKLIMGLNINNKKLYGASGESRRNFNFIKHIKIWVAIPLVIILAGFGLTAVRGLNLGVDFIGGSVIYANIGTDYDVSDIRAIVNEQGLDADILSAGQNNQDIIIRLKHIENQHEVHENIISTLQDKYNLDSDEVSIEFVGPTMGRELIRNATISILIAGALILVYIWIRFELKSGVAAVIALLHDVLVMMAVTSLMGIQINSSFIAAILTIVGYSINDTIVIFDRIRENTKRLGRKMSMSEIVDQSLNQSITRTLNTSLTTIFAVAALYFLGVESIKDFTLPILVGLISGTYSSVLIASPIWALWDKSSKDRKVAI